MRVMSAGEGYKYLLSSVAVVDGDRPAGRSMVEYYTTAGTPPGYWLGSGVAALGDGWIAPGDVVEESQLRLLLGEGCDPITGQALGRAYPQYEPRSGRTAVAGFDLTFSVPKSVSVLWALADPDTRDQVLEAHRAAVADTLRLFEAEVAATRTGVSAGDGAVAQVEVDGVAAAGFEHWDSRAVDPQLHTHVVVSNKVRTSMDGRWRALDSRPVHGSVVAISEYYNTILADRLTTTLGIEWEQRDRGRDRNPAWEITGVDDALIEAFSTRAGAIETEVQRLIADYVANHGRQPSARVVIELRQQATLATRPDKTVRSLADLTAEWRDRAEPLGVRPNWTGQILNRRLSMPSGGLSVERVGWLADRVVAVVGERRSTWRYSNLHADASRQTAGIRFPTPEARADAIRQVVAAAEQRSVRLTPPEVAPVPEVFRRADGTSVFQPANSTVYTSHDLLNAEARLLELAGDRSGPTVPPVLVDHIPAGDHPLGADQADAVRAIVGSGRVVDVLVGPAGTGKTTTMASLRAVWEHTHGQGSAIGLAPSAAAAAVLARDLGIGTENTAKWLHDYDNGNASLRAGQLVIVDEASLAGTRTLDAIADHARQAGAKVLLVGDPAQLGAVDAGGAFALIARSRHDTPTLTDVRRFTNAWEADASLALRDGDTTSIDTYDKHGRIDGGDSEAMLDAAYAGWQADLASGLDSLLIAPTRDTVTQLNSRARTDRIAAGEVDTRIQVRLHDHTYASTGDVVVTRRNDRRLSTGPGWVRNGDRWTITTAHEDGSLTLRRHTSNGTITLPAAYVAEHLELGYATTIHRAQGATVDTAHTITTPGMTRQSLYVAMTRGRHTNRAYVATDQPEGERHQDQQPAGTRQLLTGILGRAGVEPSVHDRLRVEQDRVVSIAQLAAEYDTIAALAQQPRWEAALRASGLTDGQLDQVMSSGAFGPLGAALRRAEAAGYPAEQLLPAAIEADHLNDSRDIAAVLHHRVHTMTAHKKVRTGAAIAGLIPKAYRVADLDLRTALDDRAELIEQQVTDQAIVALGRHEPWIR